MEEDRPGTEKFLKNIETFKKIGEACKKSASRCFTTTTISSL